MTDNILQTRAVVSSKNDYDDWAGRLNLAASNIVESMNKASNKNPSLKNDMNAFKKYINQIIDLIKKGVNVVPPPNTGNDKLNKLLTALVDITEYDYPNGYKAGRGGDGGHGGHGSHRGDGGHRGDGHGNRHYGNRDHGDRHYGNWNHGGWNNNNWYNNPNWWGNDWYGYGGINYIPSYWIYPTYNNLYNNYWWYNTPAWWMAWNDYFTPYYYWNTPYYVGGTQGTKKESGCNCGM